MARMYRNRYARVRVAIPDETLQCEHSERDVIALHRANDILKLPTTFFVEAESDARLEPDRSCRRAP